VKRKKSPHIVGVANNPAADPISRNKIPAWTIRVLKRAREAGHRFDMGGMRGPHTAYEAFSGMMRYDSRFSVIFDHVGQSPENHLVSEPYRSREDPELLQAVAAFALTFNLEWEFRPSCWNPPSTCRIDFWPRDLKLMRWPNRRRTR
jgi:hypothetical protein